MHQRICGSCHARFTPDHRIANQKYCSRKECQKYRRRQWQRKHLAEDEAYRENQKSAQERWKEKHPEYMREYRANHPQYRERERKRRKDAHRRVREAVENHKEMERSGAVKMDASMMQVPVGSGIYRIQPLRGGDAVKMDECFVQLTVLKQDTLIGVLP